MPEVKIVQPACRSGAPAARIGAIAPCRDQKGLCRSSGLSF